MFLIQMMNPLAQKLTIEMVEKKMLKLEIWATDLDQCQSKGNEDRKEGEGSHQGSQDEKG